MYEWDDGKAAANFAKHGVAFESAKTFDWPTAIVRLDVKHSEVEERFQAIGMIGNRLHTIVYTHRNGKIRIISLRRSHPKERRTYAEASEKA